MFFGTCRAICNKVPAGSQERGVGVGGNIGDDKIDVTIAGGAESPCLACKLD